MKCKPLVALTLIGVVFALIYCSPWIIFGEDSFVRIHDSLDSLMGWHTVMSREGLWFAANDALVVPIGVGGMPRVALPSELSLTTLLFAVLDPYRAYIAQQVIMRILAFTGIALLTLEVIPREHPRRLWLAIAGGLCFASIPFWGWTCASAGAGWVAYAVLRLWKGRNPKLSYLALAIYPFMSSIVLTGMFVVGFLWVLAFWSAWISHQMKQTLTASIVTTLAHIIADYRLFLFLLNPAFVPHRTEFATGTTDFRSSIFSLIFDFLGIAPGVPSLQSPIIVTLTLFVLMIGFASVLIKIVAPQSALSERLNISCFVEKKLWITFLLTLFAIFLFSTIYSFWQWTGSAFIREYIPLLKIVSLSRVIYFHPLIWSFAFILCLALLTVRLNRSFASLLIGGVTLGQLFTAAVSHEYVVERRQSGVTYAEFIATELFDQITSDLSIDRSNFIVASVGFHPSVLQVNRFHTADFYLSNYPLEYKHKFRELVYPEFSRREDLLSYFDDWGSRAYIFSAEMMCPRNGAICTASNNSRIEQLAIDGQQFAEFGIDYLFASTPIGNSSELGLIDLGTFQNSSSAWAITVYKTSHRGGVEDKAVP